MLFYCSSRSAQFPASTNRFKNMFYMTSVRYGCLKDVSKMVMNVQKKASQRHCMFTWLLMFQKHVGWKFKTITNVLKSSRILVHSAWLICAGCCELHKFLFPIFWWTTSRIISSLRRRIIECGGCYRSNTTHGLPAKHLPHDFYKFFTKSFAGKAE